MGDPRNVSISKCVRSANRHFSVTPGIPGNTPARIKVPPFPICGGLLRESGITREIESRRCIDELRALHAGEITPQIEIRNLAILDLLRKEGIPSNTEIESKAARQP